MQRFWDLHRQEGRKAEKAVLEFPRPQTFIGVCRYGDGQSWKPWLCVINYSHMSGWEVWTLHGQAGAVIFVGCGSERPCLCHESFC
jgi:hypothetical protein